MNDGRPFRRARASFSLTSVPPISDYLMWQAVIADVQFKIYLDATILIQSCMRRNLARTEACLRRRLATEQARNTLCTLNLSAPAVREIPLTGCVGVCTGTQVTNTCFALADLLSGEYHQVHPRKDIMSLLCYLSPRVRSKHFCLDVVVPNLILGFAREGGHREHGAS